MKTSALPVRFDASPIGESKRGSRYCLCSTFVLSKGQIHCSHLALKQKPFYTLIRYSVLHWKMGAEMPNFDSDEKSQDLCLYTNLPAQVMVASVNNFCWSRAKDCKLIPRLTFGRERSEPPAPQRIVNHTILWQRCKCLLVIALCILLEVGILQQHVLIASQVTKIKQAAVAGTSGNVFDPITNMSRAICGFSGRCKPVQHHVVMVLERCQHVRVEPI